MIEWLIQRAADDPLVTAGVPPEGLLSAPETAVYSELHSAKRRKDWLLGRWTAKTAVQAAAGKAGERSPALREISILAAQDGAPDVWLGENGRLRRAGINISISHSHDVSFCAAITPDTHTLGADIELIEPRSASFVDDYFSSEEKERVRQAPPESRDFLVTAIWSGKEAALKAVRQGLRLDTRSVICEFPSPLRPYENGQESKSWHFFTVRWRYNIAYPPFGGWWRVWQGFVLTLVAVSEPLRTPERQRVIEEKRDQLGVYDGS